MHNKGNTQIDSTRGAPLLAHDPYFQFPFGVLVGSQTFVRCSINHAPNATRKKCTYATKEIHKI